MKVEKNFALIKYRGLATFEAKILICIQVQQNFRLNQSSIELVLYLLLISTVLEVDSTIQCLIYHLAQLHQVPQILYLIFTFSLFVHIRYIFSLLYFVFFSNYCIICSLEDSTFMFTNQCCICNFFIPNHNVQCW